MPATQNIVIITSCDFRVQKGLGGRGYAFKHRLGLVLAPFWLRFGFRTVFRAFPTFSRTCIFSLLLFSMSELLAGRGAFPCVHIVGSLALASKLPSMIHFGAHVPFNIELPSHT